MIEVTTKDIANLKQWIANREYIREKTREEILSMNPEYVVRGVVHAVFKAASACYTDKQRVATSDSFFENNVYKEAFQVWHRFLFRFRSVIGATLEDFVYAVLSREYPDVKDWCYGIEGNPYTPAIELWDRGFIAADDGLGYKLFSRNGSKELYKLDDKEENKDATMSKM